MKKQKSAWVWVGASLCAFGIGCGGYPPDVQVGAPLPQYPTEVPAQPETIPGFTLPPREENTGPVQIGGERPKQIGVLCGVALTPYITDLKTGAKVELLPGRYTMHVDSNVELETLGQSWILKSSRALSVTYDITDNQTGTIVLRDRANLSCGQSRTGEIARPSYGPIAVPPPHLDSSPGFVARPAPGEVPAGPYVVGITFGTILAAGGVGILGWGLASLFQGDTTDPFTGAFDDSASTRGVILVNIGPHVLTAGIITLVWTQHAHTMARLQAGLAYEPFVIPVTDQNKQLRGAVVGVGHSF